MQPPVSDRLPRVAQLLLILLVALAVSLAAGTRSYDDAYITYTYARSVADGAGLRWHGEAVLGTSTPFLALLLGGLERLWPLGIPVWGAVLSGLAGVGGALALLGLGRRQGWAWGALATALFWLLWPGRYGHNGGEMPLAISLVAAAAWAFAARRPWLAGTLLAVATALRAETALAAPILAGAVVGRDGLRIGLREVGRAAAIAGGLVLVWAWALYSIAGTVLPRTLEAKQAQAASALGIWDSAGLSFLAGEGGWLVEAASGPLGILFALSVLGLVVAYRRRLRFGVALVLWGFAHLLLLAALGVPRYSWYVEPFRFALLVTAGMGVAAPGLLSGRPARRARWTAALLVLVLLGFGIEELVQHSSGGGDERERVYFEIAAAANEYPPGTSLAAYEVGFLGYACRQPVLDLLGLVSPRVDLDAVRSGDLASARRILDPDLLLLPLSGGKLLLSVLGDPAEFLADYRLERLRLGGRPNVALYRRASLAGLGPVQLDLLPGLHEGGGRVEVISLANEGAPVLRLAPGERRSVPLPPGSRGRLVFAVGAEAAGDTLAVELGVGGEWGRIVDVPIDAASHWYLESLPLAPDVLPRHLAFACSNDGGSDCLVGLPHLASGP